MGRRSYKGQAGRRKPRLQPDGDPHGLVALKAEFLAWMQVRNYTERTQQTCDDNLEQFLIWCAERGLTRASEVSLPILERYQRWLFHYRKKGGQPLSFGSQQSRLGSVRAFFRYLSRTHRVLSNPASELTLPRTAVRLPREVLTAEEAERVLALPDLSDTLGLRDRTILETFYATGVRRNELIRLALYDVDRRRGLLTVREGKGQRDRVVPIGERALFWIERYLTEARPKLAVEPDAQRLFLNACGEPLAPETLSILVTKYVQRAELGKRGSCHLFRHTMATLMLEGGADVRFIQEMLGHRRLESTQIYTRVSPQKLKAIHAATHPAAKLQTLRPKPAASSEQTPQGAEPAREDLLAALQAEAAKEDEGQE